MSVALPDSRMLTFYPVPNSAGPRAARPASFYLCGRTAFPPLRTMRLPSPLRTCYPLVLVVIRALQSSWWCGWSDGSLVVVHRHHPHLLGPLPRLLRPLTYLDSPPRRGAESSPLASHFSLLRAVAAAALPPAAADHVDVPQCGAAVPLSSPPPTPPHVLSFPASSSTDHGNGANMVLMVGLEAKVAGRVET